MFNVCSTLTCIPEILDPFDSYCHSPFPNKNVYFSLALLLQLPYLFRHLVIFSLWTVHAKHFSDLQTIIITVYAHSVTAPANITDSHNYKIVPGLVLHAEKLSLKKKEQV